MSFIGECLSSIDASLDTSTTDIVDAARAEETQIIARIANGGRRHVYDEIFADEMLARKKRRICTITNDVVARAMIDTGVCVKSRTPTCSPNNVDRKALSIEHARPPLAPRLFSSPSQESPQEVVRGGNTLGGPGWCSKCSIVIARSLIVSCCSQPAQ
jgi:hypothetical protein